MEELRTANEQGVVRGLGGVLPVTPRLDVDVLLLEHPDTFNLFCLAMLDFMQCKSSDLMGFYQIAGIHGIPKCLWDGIPSAQKDRMGSAPKTFSGYCSHSSPLFPTWHRPYLAMFEQTIFLKMLDIAEQFPGQVKESYVAAAKEFRYPYWDYFRPRAGQTQYPGVGSEGAIRYPYNFKAPDIFNVSKIVLRTPKKNKLELCDNPFYLYRFPSSNGIPDSDWDTLYLCVKSFSKTETQRFPLSEDPTQDFDLTLNKAREDGVRYAINIISDHDKYENLFNAKNDSKKSSLEGLHDDYHERIGGQGGHMSRVPTAAFDPLFWFHHCQIDRLFAIWQGVHPDEWFEADDIDLTPMRKSKTPQTFWNSEDSRYTTTFGYTYPDLDGDPEQVKHNFIRNYSWAMKKAENDPSPPAGMAPLDLTSAQVFRYDDVGIVAATDIPLLEASKSQVRRGRLGPYSDKPFASLQVTPSEPSTIDMPAQYSSTVPSGNAVEADEGIEHIKDTIGITDVNDSALAIDDQSWLANTVYAVQREEIFREWYIEYEVERLALNDAFTIYYFLGDPPDAEVSTGKYLTWPTLAASSHIFTAPVELCQNCKGHQESKHVMGNAGYLTSVLKDYVQFGELADLCPRNVEHFLVKNLKWRVVSINGGRIDPRTIPSLRFNVTSKVIDQQGKVTYDEYPRITEDIIANSSRFHRKPAGVQSHRFQSSL